MLTFFDTIICSLMKILQVDPRLVIQFEKISGFGSVAAKLVCNLSGDSEVIIDCLLSIFFWERGQKGSGQLVEVC